GNTGTVLYSSGSFSAVYTGTKCGFVATQYLSGYQSGGSSASNLSRVISAAEGMIGAPYSISLAGQYAPNGKLYTDCSYLTQYCFAKVGVSLPRNAADQAQYLVNKGLSISYSALTAGDLIFYSSYYNGRYKNITHVALYVGDGYIIDASSSKGVVVRRKLWGSPILYCDASALVQ
ncbi:MAG: C40 family peptidase, partial [Acutalibacteraceae bacterium]